MTNAVDYMTKAAERAVDLMEIRDNLRAALVKSIEAGTQSHKVWDSYPSTYNERPRQIDALITMTEMTISNVTDQIMDAVVQVANLLSDDIAKAARTSREPVEWITGNRYMPPLRDFTVANDIYLADDDGDVWERFVEHLNARLDGMSVLIACPEHDNALYVVDLLRWERSEAFEKDTADDVNDEWSFIDPQ